MKNIYGRNSPNGGKVIIMTKNELYEFLHRPIRKNSLTMFLSWAAIVIMASVICISLYLIIKDAYKDIYHPYGPYDVTPVSSDYFQTAVSDDNNNTLIIKSYNGYFTQLVVPDEINDTKVSEIDRFSFMCDSNIKEVYIPYGITYIGNMAFYDCENLTKIYIPETVEEIGGWAFSGTDKNFRICAETDTYAEKYCKDRKIKFEAVN